MIESIKYWLEVAWLTFLFLPLFFCIIIAIVAGCGAIYAIFCNWLIPVTTAVRGHLKGFKETAGNLEKEREYLHDVAHALGDAQDKLKEILADVRTAYDKNEKNLEHADEDRKNLNEIERLLTNLTFPRHP